MPDLGQAYVQIVPSAEGITEKISGVIDPAMNKAGVTGGKSLAQSIGKSFGTVGKGMTAMVTAPLAAIGAASVAAFNEVDAGMDTIIQKTGASGAALEDMQTALEGIATTVPTDFKTAGAAIGEVNTRFGLTGTALEKLSGQFVQFSSLNNTDVSTSIDSVQKALATFGLGADKAGGLLDRLNSVGQNTGISVDKLTTGLVKNGAAFQEMGLSIDQAAVFMGNLETSGAESDTVLQGLRRALKNATEEGTSMSDALEQMQNSILNGTDSMDGLSAAYELFGRNGDAIYNAVKNGTIDFRDLGAAVDDVSGNVATTFEDTLDPADKFKLVMNELKIVGADIGATMGDILMPALEKVRDIIQRLKEKWDALSPGTQEMIVKAAMIAAAIGPVLLGISTVITTVSTLMTTMRTMSTMISALSAGPLGLIVIAITAAVAAGVLLYQNWDEICAWAGELKQKVVDAWSNLKEKVVDFASNIKENVTGAWDTMKTKVSDVTDKIKTTVSDKFNSIKSTISNAWENVKTNTANAWSNIQNRISQNGGGIRGVIATAMEGYKSVWSNGFSFLDQVTGGKLSSIYQWFVDKFHAIQNFISPVVDWLKGLFNFQWSLPHIKLPHFSWSWIDLGGVISIPRISVSWYKKAYETPYLFTDPTVVGNRGFGDGGGSGEIVYGRDQLMRDIAEASSGEITINVYPSAGMDERALADMVQQKLAQLQRQKRTAWGMA